MSPVPMSPVPIEFIDALQATEERLLRDTRQLFSRIDRLGNEVARTRRDCELAEQRFVAYVRGVEHQLRELYETVSELRESKRRETELQPSF
jgi:hypothetical protein